MATPAARNFDDLFGQDLLLVDGEGPTHAVVVEGPGTAVGDDVEPGEVAAGTAPVAGGGGGVHAGHATGTARRPGPCAAAPSPKCHSLVHTVLPMATTAPEAAVTGGCPSDPLLYDVTFVVVDTETTGGTPETGTLIELAAAVYRGGERLGALDTLVDPGGPIPPFVQELTGISDAMVAGAPRLEEVLPQLGALLGDAVVVGHNVAFDVGFLDAGLARCGLVPLANACVDTLGLARRLVRDLVPDCALGTLAQGLRLDHRPSHRAMADVLATADLLHRLIEISTGYGVLRLSELLALPERLSPMPLRARGTIAGSFTAA